MTITAILLAAGSSRRMNQKSTDKNLEIVENKPVLCYSIEALITSKVVNKIIIAYKDDSQLLHIKEIVNAYNDAIEIDFVPGGNERQDSVYNALTSGKINTTHVFMHDAARFLIQPSMLQSIAHNLKNHSAVVCGHSVLDTIVQIEPSENNTFICTNLDRSKLWANETPQAFETKLITNAYEIAIKNKYKLTDDVSTLAYLEEKVPIYFVQNPIPNIKLTRPSDLDYSKFLLKNILEEVN